MASRRRRGGKRSKPNAHWDVDLKQLEETLLLMDPTSREFSGTANVFMAARWQSVQALQEADENSDHLLDTGEWVTFWLSDERGDHKMMSETVATRIFSVMLDKKNRGRVTMTDVDKFGKMCQRTWRELSSRGLGKALKKYSWFSTVVHEVADEPEPQPEPEQKAEERDLEKENAELTALVEELEETCDTLRDQVNESEDSVEDLRQKVDCLTEEGKEKDQKIEEQKQEIDRLVSEMCDGQAAFAEELKRAREHADQQAAEHKAKEEELERQMAELKRELADALEQGKVPEHFCNIPGHTDALAELEQLKKEVEEAAKMIVELEQEKQGRLEEIERLQNASLEKDKRIEELEAKLQEANQEMARKDAEHQQEKQELQARVAELEPLVGELEQAKETINEKDNIIAELKNLLAQKDDHIAAAKKMNDDLQQNNDKLSEELAALKHELAEKNEELEALASSSGDAANQLEALMARRDDEIARLTQQLEAMKHKLKHSQDEMKELNKRKNIELRDKDAEIQALRDALENQKTLNEGWESEGRRLQEALKNMRESSEERQTVVINLEQTILELRAQLAESRQEVIVLTARLDESESQNNGQDWRDFEKEISFRDGRITELERQLERAQSRMKRASVMVQHVQTVQAARERDQELVQIREELAEAVNKEEEARKIREKQSSRQNAMLWKQLGAKTVANEKLQKRIRELEKMLELSEQRRDNLDDAFNQQMKELRSHLTLSRDESNGRKMAMQAEIEILKKQRDRLTQEKEDLRQYYDVKYHKVLDKLKHQRDYCAKHHGAELRDRVSQVRFNVKDESRDSHASDDTVPSIPEETEESVPDQKTSESMTVIHEETINISILDLERVLVEGNYKVGVLPSEIFCCGILCCGSDWYCCSKANNIGEPQEKKGQVGQ